MPRTGFYVALILTVSATVFLTNLGGAKLWDRDEPRNAACTREMLERGDWVTPYFNGELRAHKPILTYWLMMASYRVFGVNEFAARFPSAMLGIVTVLATFVIARRLFSREVGLWSALALASSLLFSITARAATPDAGLIAASALAIMLYVAGTFRRKTAAEDERRAPPQLRTAGKYFPTWPVALAMYACMGVGVLAKGPVGVLVPTAVIGMFMLVMRLPSETKPKPHGATDANWNFLHWSLLAAVLIATLLLDAWIGPLKTFLLCALVLVGYGLWRPQSLAAKLIRPFEPQTFLATCWEMRPLTALAVVLAIAAPWYVWVGLRTDGVWLREFFYTHNVARATQVFEGHRGTYLFYPSSIFGGFFPWSMLLLPALIGYFVRLRRREPWHIGYVFAACWIGVYMAAFSLARTKLPTYIAPAYPAVAMVLGTFLMRWSHGEATSRVWPRLSFSLLALVGVGLSIGLPIVAHIFAPGDEWLGLVGLLPLTAAVVCFTLHIRQLPHVAAGCMAAFATIMMFVSLGFITSTASRHQHIEALLETTRASSDEPLLATYGAHEPSWVFYWRKPLPVVGEQDVREIASYLHNPDAFLLTTERALPTIEPLLPPDVAPLARKRSFMKKYDLILLGRTPAGVALARQRGESANLH